MDSRNEPIRFDRAVLMRFYNINYTLPSNESLDFCTSIFSEAYEQFNLISSSTPKWAVTEDMTKNWSRNIDV